MGSESDKSLGALLVAMLIMAAAVGCEDIQPLDVDATLLALAGTWEASVFEYTSQVDTLQRVDLIEEGGSATLVISANGAYTLTVFKEGFEPATESFFIRGHEVAEVALTLRSR